MHPSHHHHSASGTEPSTQVELDGNLIIYGLASLAFIVILAIAVGSIHGCIQAAVMDDYYEISSAEEGEAGPLALDLTLTADGELVNNGPEARHSGQYGTFSYDGAWYHNDGTKMTYHEWILAVYDPLD
ncbi:hypothetical protein diail_7773 [Diaporthe ilicicola]|nr:hypothetical protein diail_7773 [Diaporthe ilicicola]